MPLKLQQAPDPPFRRVDQGAPDIDLCDSTYIVGTQLYTQRVHLFMVRKDVAFKIRIDEELRRTFVEACQAEDRPAAQVVREFMRGYVAQRQQTETGLPSAGTIGTKPGTEPRRNKGG